MLFDADLAALISTRLGLRWQRAPEVQGLDNHLRRDLGLPPASAPVLPLLRRYGF
jgi:hypothetical protein